LIRSDEIKEILRAVYGLSDPIELVPDEDGRVTVQLAGDQKYTLLQDEPNGLSPMLVDALRHELQKRGFSRFARQVHPHAAGHTEAGPAPLRLIEHCGPVPRRPEYIQEAGVVAASLHQTGQGIEARPSAMPARLMDLASRICRHLHSQWGRSPSPTWRRKRTREAHEWLPWIRQDLHQGLFGPGGTIIHGDYTLGSLGVNGENRVVLAGWNQMGRGPSHHDIFSLVTSLAWSKEACEAVFSSYQLDYGLQSNMWRGLYALLSFPWELVSWLPREEQRGGTGSLDVLGEDPRWKACALTKDRLSCRAMVRDHMTLPHFWRPVWSPLHDSSPPSAKSDAGRPCSCAEPETGDLAMAEETPREPDDTAQADELLEIIDAADTTLDSAETDRPMEEAPAGVEDIMDQPTSLLDGPEDESNDVSESVPEDSASLILENPPPPPKGPLTWTFPASPWASDDPDG